MEKTKMRTVLVKQVTRHLVIEEKICPQCKKVFEGPRVAKFCAKTCANKASYARNAEQYRARRREKYRRQK